MDTDVLVVGAGPTGLMLANQLGRRGVRTMLIDRHSGPAQQTRAIGVQARTLEIYAKLGVAEQALELGARAERANMWANGQHKAHIPLGDIGKDLSRFPFVFMLGQDDNERILGEKLRDWDIAVQWNTELLYFQQQSDHVVATLKQADGSLRTISAAWVAGCDGAHSRVRELSGITFPGAPYEHVFFVADTVAAGDMVCGELNVYLWKESFHLFFPMRGKNRWRVIGILPASLRDRDDVTLDEIAPQVRQAVGGALTFHECLWLSTYRIHHRCAAQFRDRRCFLLGDAAHIHSPVGAQGMNTGLQDAYNLAWKLALVIKGAAADSLLESYALERMPVAQRLLRTTDSAFMLVVSSSWTARFFRTYIFPNLAAFVMRQERLRRFAFQTVSQIGIRYRNSLLSRTLVGVPKDAPQAGDRFPWLRLRLRDDGPVEDFFARLDDLRFNLLVVGQPIAAAQVEQLGADVCTHLIARNSTNDQEFARAKVPAPSFYLLRPDGHIALAGTHFDSAAITAYFTDNHIRSARWQPR